MKHTPTRAETRRARVLLRRCTCKRAGIDGVHASTCQRTRLLEQYNAILMLEAQKADALEAEQAKATTLLETNPAEL